MTTIQFALQLHDESATGPFGRADTALGEAPAEFSDLDDRADDRTWHQARIQSSMGSDHAHASANLLVVVPYKSHPLGRTSDLWVIFDDHLDEHPAPAEAPDGSQQDYMLKIPVLLDENGSVDETLYLGGQEGTRGLLSGPEFLAGTLVNDPPLPPLRYAMYQRSGRGWTKLHHNSGQWDTMRGKRVLLFLHGTGMGAKASMGKMGPLVDKLLNLYDDRVIAFNHITVLKSVADNVKHLLDRVPADMDMEVDIVCVSRGGVVARYFVEQADYGARKIDVRNVIYVASPLTGTPTALPSKKDVAMAFRGIFHEAPTPEHGQVPVKPENEPTGGPGSWSSEDDLFPGRKDQAPGSPLLTTMNTHPKGDPRARHPHLVYRGITSRYQLPPPRAAYAGLRDKVAEMRKQVLQAFTFKRAGRELLAENDLIVPNDAALGVGVDAVELDGLLPIDGDRAHVWQPDDRVTHLGYLSHPGTRDRIFTWLSV
jgi:hypothetical protein